jgi:hypothetical protein
VFSRTITRSTGLPQRAEIARAFFAGRMLANRSSACAARRRIDAALVGGRIVVVRYRPEDHAVGCLCRGECAFRKRRAFGLQRREPDLHLFEREFDLPAAPAARSTASVAAVISGPMPSPCITQRRSGGVLERAYYLGGHPGE